MYLTITPLFELILWWRVTPCTCFKYSLKFKMPYIIFRLCATPKWSLVSPWPPTENVLALPLVETDGHSHTRAPSINRMPMQLIVLVSFLYLPYSIIQQCRTGMGKLKKVMAVRDIVYFLLQLNSKVPRRSLCPQNKDIYLPWMMFDSAI